MEITRLSEASINACQILLNCSTLSSSDIMIFSYDIIVLIWLWTVHKGIVSNANTMQGPLRLRTSKVLLVCPKKSKSRVTY